MRTLNKGLIAGLGMMAFASAVQADEGYGYIGGQINYFYDDSAGSSVHPISVTAVGGYQFTPYLGLEGRVGTSVQDDEWRNSGIKVEVDHHYGAYLTGTLPVSDGFHFYALAGYAKAKATAKGSGSSYSADESDFSYGGGAKLLFGKNWEASVEYVSLVEDLDSINLGISYKF